MAKICQSCGGIIGRDCFNPMECAIITARENSYREGQIINTEQSVNELWRQFEALKQILVRSCVISGIEMDIIQTPPAELQLEYHETVNNQDDLPF